MTKQNSMRAGKPRHDSAEMHSIDRKTRQSKKMIGNGGCVAPARKRHAGLQQVPARRGAVRYASPDVAALAAVSASWFGVTVSLYLARLCFYRLHSTTFGIALPPLAASKRGLAEQFVLQVLVYLASTRTVTVSILGEPALVHVVQGLLTSTVIEPTFRAALEALWMSPAMVAGLRMRGAIGKVLVNSLHAKLEAAQHADVAEHGLLICALPGCDKKEAKLVENKAW